LESILIDEGWGSGKMESRRHFLGKALAAGGLLLFGKSAFPEIPMRKRPVSMNGETTVYRAVNGTPAENIDRVFELAGGIERIVGVDDVVVVKPNVQWWNQGAPNLSAMARLVEKIFERPGGFRGEVVVAENVHRGSNPLASRSSGWVRPFERNSDIPGVRNIGECAVRLKEMFGKRFSLRTWINVDSGGRRVRGPEDGDGYVYCDGTGGAPLFECDNGLAGERRRKTFMTYPIFTTEQGTVVDYRKGVWEKGSYTGRPMKIFLLSALNHHSVYCGMTSSLKNYMGIVDLSGGPDPHNGGRLSGEYYNVHSFPFDKWASGPAAGMLGTAIGTFLQTVRRADLHITTAEWVGLSSRVDGPAARTRAVLAGADPVALDFHAAKYILYANSGISVHDPENENGPVSQYLRKAAETGAGILDEGHVVVQSYDCERKGPQPDGDLAILGEKSWGTDPRAVAKYLYLRLAY
jgi:hypothetical protein